MTRAGNRGGLLYYATLGGVGSEVGSEVTSEVRGGCDKAVKR